MLAADVCAVFCLVSLRRGFFMEYRTTLMQEKNIISALKRISFEIIEQNGGCERLILLGIRRRGVPLAHRIAANIRDNEGVDIPVGELDITFYRDDLEPIQDDPIVSRSYIDFNLTGMNVILVDDVLYTGRTIRAAMDAVMDIGRPASIKAAVLIDRGHRELPIKANYVGKNVPTAEREFISVQLEEYDGCNQVDLFIK